MLLRVRTIDLIRDMAREPRDQQCHERDPDHGNPRGDQDTIPAEQSAEARIEQFAELVALGLANAEARAEVAASRARIVAAGDAERRRLERNLHDGAQQQLVTLSLALRSMVDAHAPNAPRSDESDGLVTVFRGDDREVLSCTPMCKPGAGG